MPVQQTIKVAKFGGTSVADYDAMLRCAQIIQNDSETRVVVVSASAGVTNLLVDLSQNEKSAEQIAEQVGQIRQIQYKITARLANESELNQQINLILDQLATMVTKQQQQFSAQLADDILACGERMSSLLFAQVLQSLQLPGLCFDVRQVMKTNSLYGKAVVDIDALHKQSQQLLLPLTTDHVVVTQGFIGEDGLGNTTTLGRGGSDYSAALLAEALDASYLAIWTDVVGIFTTDPRLTSAARALPEISFGEAAEMATFGAKVLHPATLIPAMRKNIPVFVGSSREPQAGGTRICQQVDSKPTYRSIALRREQTLVTVKSPEMLHASGFLAKVFAILAKHELSVDLITTSEISVALTLDNPAGSTQAQLTEAVVKELGQMCEVSVEHGLSLVAIIGNNLHDTQGLGSSVFDTINDFHIRMICHGASSNNLCFLVNELDAPRVVERLHDTLFV
jgi:aspartate kinase